MYQAPAVHPPSVEQIEKLAAELNLGIAKSDLPDYHAIVTGNLKGYDTLEKYVEPVLPVKYPRTPGYRPQGEENKYNAWYYKSVIQGAPEGPLKGYKIAVKDCFPVAGVPMMNGSTVLEGYVPDYDPTVITRILEAGGTLLGKAVCEDFSFSGSSFTSHPLPVFNPHDTSRTCGGSSSGCAVLVQCGDVDMAVGGDQGGSIRGPSAWTGVVGLKPSYGLVPFTGIPSMIPSVDHCGPMARTVKNCALLLEVMAGDDDGLDMRQRRIPDQKDLPKYSKLLTGEVSGKRIGLLKEGFLNIESDIAALVRQAAQRLTEKGAIVEEVSVPMHTDAMDIFGPSANAGYVSTLHKQGHPIGPPSYYATSAIDNYISRLKTRSPDLSVTVKERLLAGQYELDNYGLHFYAKSQNLSRLLKQEYNKVLDKYDALLMPTAKCLPPKLPLAGQKLSVQGYVESAFSTLTSNSCAFNITGHPAISINAGFLSGLPVGMQLVGRYLADDALLNVAYAYEQLLDIGIHG